MGFNERGCWHFVLAKSIGDEHLAAYTLGQMCRTK
jgi:hypothetical protein